MALADLAAQTTSGIPWRTCAVCYHLATIPPREAAGLRALLRSGRRYTEIRDLIAVDPDTPLDIDDATLSRHARGRCEAREKLR